MGFRRNSFGVQDYDPLVQKTINRIQSFDQVKEVTDQVELVKTPDTLFAMGESKRKNQTLMGFALETDDGIESAKSKLDRKNLDFVVLNTLADDGAGFSHDTNKVTVIKRVGVDTEMLSFELKSKTEVARDLVEILFQDI